MKNPNITDSHSVTNEMQVNLHMLRPQMLNRVGGEVHSADVVAVDERALGKRAMKLSQELSESRRLSHAVSNSPSARYSASTLERETISCRLDDDDQEIRLSTRKTA
jgi:hypothetical protein